MLKELEEPGKERVRHLNHRKEKDPPHDSQPRGRNNMQSNHKNKPQSQVSSMKNRASKNQDALLRLFKATCCYSSTPRTFFNSSSAGGRILHAFDQDKQSPAWRTQPAFPLISGHQNPSGIFEKSWLLEVSTRQTALENRITQTSLTIKSSRLLSRVKQTHTTAASELRSGWVKSTPAALCRVRTSSSTAGAPTELWGALQGSGA